MTGTQVHNRASRILLDTSATRWDKTQVLDWINDGLDEIHRVRPDAFYTGDKVTVVDTPPKLSQLGDSLTCRSSFDPAVVDYLVYRCLSVDSEDVANMARADKHLQLFLARL